MKTLSSEEVFDASKNGFSTYGKFFKAVAKEIGMERALELHGSGYEDYGPFLDPWFRTLSLEELGAARAQQSRRSCSSKRDFILPA